MMDRSRLAAYVDGNLEPEDAAAVVMHLADNPADQAYVEHLTELNTVLCNAYDAPVREPVPGRIYDTIFPPEPQRLTDWSKTIRDWFRPAAFTLAAAAAIAIFLNIGPPPANVAGIHTGPVPPDSSLHGIFEARRSGDTGQIDDNMTVTLIAMFLDGDGQPCREYELEHPGGNALTRGIACRRDTGWDIAMTATENIENFGSGQNGYITAEGPSNSAVSTALDSLGAGPSLTPEQEANMLSSGWDSDRF